MVPTGKATLAVLALLLVVVDKFVHASFDSFDTFVCDEVEFVAVDAAGTEIFVFVVVAKGLTA